MSLPSAFTDQLLGTTLKNEGKKYTNNPNDRGGPTKYGVSLRFASRLSVQNGQLLEVHPHGGTVTEDDIKELTWDKAEAMYLQIFLYEPHIDELPIEIVAEVFDGAIHHGPEESIRLVQQVINLAGFGPIAEDGIAGLTTSMKAHAAQDAMGSLFINAICDQRISFMWDCVRKYPANREFMVAENGVPGGWQTRVDAFRQPVQAVH